jgi:hypothetical protein
MASVRLKKYIEGDRKEKEGKAIKGKERGYVEKLLKRCKRLGVEISGVSISEGSRFNVNEDALFTWVKSQVSAEELEDLTKRTIDLERLQEFVILGKLDTLKAPLEAFSETKFNTVRINHKEIS